MINRYLLSLGALALTALAHAGPADAKPTGCWAWCYRHGDSPACYRECDQTSVTKKASVVRKGNTPSVRGRSFHR